MNNKIIIEGNLSDADKEKLLHKIADAVLGDKTSEEEEAIVNKIRVTYKYDPKWDEICEIYNQVYFEANIRDRVDFGIVSQEEELNFYLGRKDALEDVLGDNFFFFGKEENKNLKHRILSQIKEEKEIINNLKEALFESAVEKLKAEDN